MSTVYTATEANEKNNMKIAITGHSAGIGQALAKQYESRGHEIIGLSKRNGHNIRNIPKIANLIEPCDMFINNAQVGFAQTELLFEMAKRWQGSQKHIMVISTMMTEHSVSVLPDITEYWCQKTVLELAVSQLKNQHLGIKFTVVRPGDIATSNNKTVPPSADVNNWATSLLDILDLAEKNNLRIPTISMGALT
jgi:NADP-dependent 3-hydroxy acid dehydrogenase YdfG